MSAAKRIDPFDRLPKSVRLKGISRNGTVDYCNDRVPLRADTPVLTKAAGNSRSGIPGNPPRQKFPAGIPGNY